MRSPSARILRSWTTRNSNAGEHHTAGTAEAASSRPQKSRASFWKALFQVGIAQVKTEVTQAENAAPKITVLPSVKLPADNAWMSQTERAGSDGTIQVAVTETASGVSVHKTWMGGDGGMTGAVILTTIPYDDIGNIDFECPTRVGDDKWTVRVHCAGTSFPEALDSPQRTTARATFPAVHHATTKNAVYFVFLNPMKRETPMRTSFTTSSEVDEEWTRFSFGSRLL
jgi:hypothetical protein